MALVEDDPVWQEGLAVLLEGEPDFSLVEVATSKEQAMHTIEQLDFDVLLLDMMLAPPDYDGLDLAREVLEQKPFKIIMLTSVDEAELVGNSIHAGVLNYVTTKISQWR